MLEETEKIETSLLPAELIIFPKPPFNFNLLTALYAKWPNHFIETFTEGCYERTLEIEEGNRMLLVRIKSEGSIDSPKLRVTIIPAPGKPNAAAASEKEWVEETVKWMFSTEDDLSGFYNLMNGFPAYRDMISKLKGLKPPKTPTIFEAAIIAISEQEIALKAAISIRKRLIEKYGRSFFINGKQYFTFPGPAAISKAEPEEIRALGFTFRKGQYMIELADKVISGEIDFELMKNWQSAEIIKELGKMKGFGPWTIKYILQRGFGRFETVPFEDLGLRNGLTAILGKTERISEKEAKDFFEPFGEYKGYFAFYLLYEHLLNL